MYPNDLCGSHRSKGIQTRHRIWLKQCDRKNQRRHQRKLSPPEEEGRKRMLPAARPVGHLAPPSEPLPVPETRMAFNSHLISTSSSSINNPLHKGVVVPPPPSAETWRGAHTFTSFPRRYRATVGRLQVHVVRSPTTVSFQVGFIRWRLNKIQDHNTNKSK